MGRRTEGMAARGGREIEAGGRGKGKGESGEEVLGGVDPWVGDRQGWGVLNYRDETLPTVECIDDWGAAWVGASDPAESDVD
jgi:hypothetical protein